MFDKVRRLFGLERDLTMVQTSIADTLDKVTNVQLIDGNILSNLVLPSLSRRSFQHKLGRKIIGWILIDNIANSNIWKISSDNNFITLESNSDTIVSIWVF